MVHISELADYRVDKVEDIVKLGDEITVKVTEIDSQGRINLSRRAVFEKTSELSDSHNKGAFRFKRPYNKYQNSHSSQRSHPKTNKPR